MGYVFAAPPQVVVPVQGSSDLFPVRRVYCVGRNYEDHAREMGFSGREPPFFFAKPADALLPVPEGTLGRLPYPPATADLHHEVELVAAIGRRARDVAAGEAAACIWGYAVGLDMTRRDRQVEARAQGRPWEVAKAFGDSAPVGPIRPLAATGLVRSGGIRLSVNGAVRQNSDISQLTWHVEEIIEQLSRCFDLAPGDLIFTGTPAGVGPVVVGDTMDAAVDGVGSLRVEVV
jgi:fumarylpyruvate hydrolase